MEVNVPNRQDGSPESKCIITIGDPAGVGPEVTCRALADLDPAEQNNIAISGCIPILERAAAVTNCDLKFVGAGASTKAGEIEVHHIDYPGDLPEFGKLSTEAGDAAFRYIEQAIRVVQKGDGACIVTAPINKEALNSAGHHYDGHTGMLAHLTGARSSFMLLASESLSVIHVSTHVALRGAIEKLRSDRVQEAIEVADSHFRRLGVSAPRIAVAGLNPHCGEHGLFGDEDETIIVPAIERARANGLDARGPISADTVFYRASIGEFDVVVAQYHDQGHIPVKLIAFHTAVNVSLGLPIDRTSVDHGTAFDIAGTGAASHVNMSSALAYGRLLAASPRVTK